MSYFKRGLGISLSFIGFLLLPVAFIGAPILGLGVDLIRDRRSQEEMNQVADELEDIASRM